MIHHSDRGIQHDCGDYADLLQRHDIAPSMSRVGNPYDNAKAESFMKTLKQERSTARLTAMRSMPEMQSPPPSRTCTIANGCARLWPTGRLPSSKQIYRDAGSLRSSIAAVTHHPAQPPQALGSCP
nr:MULTISPECIES: integrase core domain-containing protein [unclassified Bradyrhizobium]